MLVTTGDVFSYFLAMIGVFVVSAELVLNVSAKIEVMIVGLTGGFMDRLAGVAIETLAKLTAFFKLCMLVLEVLAAVFALKLAESTSYVMDL